MINNYKLSKSFISKLRSGRPSKLTFREKRYFLKFMHLNPKITASQIINYFRDKFKKRTLHEVTICKILKKVHYHSRVAHRKPHISVVNKEKHLTSANEYAKVCLQFWEKVIYSGTLVRLNSVSLASKGINWCKEDKLRLLRSKVVCLQFNIVKVA